MSCHSFAPCSRVSCWGLLSDAMSALLPCPPLLSEGRSGGNREEERGKTKEKETGGRHQNGEKKVQLPKSPYPTVLPCKKPPRAANIVWALARGQRERPRLLDAITNRKSVVPRRRPSPPIPGSSPAKRLLPLTRTTLLVQFEHFPQCAKLLLLRIARRFLRRLFCELLGDLVRRGQFRPGQA